jgi:hypothetical protein
MTTSPVTTITDELLTEIEAAAIDSKLNIYRPFGWDHSVRCGNHLQTDFDFLSLVSPPTVHAIITELRTLRAENAANRAAMVFVRDAADILRTLIENIDSRGNYSPEATALFLNQVLGCIHAAMQEQPQ